MLHEDRDGFFDKPYNKGIADKTQVQYAIWYFIDGGYSGGDPVVTGLINDAKTAVLSGWWDSFPQVGDDVAVLLDCGFWPGTQNHYQWIFIEVDP